MNPPTITPEATVSAELPRLRRLPDALGARFRLAAAAAGVLAVCVLGALAVDRGPALLEGLASRPAGPGTAFLGTATCADWHAAGAARRTTIAASLASAATAPDPENPGATLDRGATFGLFATACSTQASRSALLYEIYNRAASFRAGAARSGSLGSPGFGTAAHR
jgi:hypothetical protein